VSTLQLRQEKWHLKSTLAKYSSRQVFSFVVSSFFMTKPSAHEMQLVAVVSHVLQGLLQAIHDLSFVLLKYPSGHAF
jgi:hypothetical protein